MTTLPSISSLFKDPLADESEPRQAENDGELGSVCELTVKEARYNAKGELRFLYAGSTRAFDDANIDNPESAMKLTKFYSRRGALDYTEMEIRSPHIKAALSEVVHDYPDADFGRRCVVIRTFEKLLFHYESELREYGRKLSNETAARHLNFALQYLHQTLDQQLRKYRTNVKLLCIPTLDFISLWMVFRPGDLVYLKRKNFEAITRFRDMTRCICTLPFCPESAWDIELDVIIYDGTDFGYGYENAFIEPYDGYKPLPELSVVPLQYHPRRHELETKMLARGRKFVELHGFHHCSYDGLATTFDIGSRESSQVTKITGRIIVDGKEYSSASGVSVESMRDSCKIFRTANGDHLRMTDAELKICTDEVMGFSLVAKKWGLFKIDQVANIEYNMEAYDDLLLDNDHKEMIKSMVTIHEEGKIGFDDIIKGKGKGIIFLLHGPPGVGKTLTAGNDLLLLIHPMGSPRPAN